MRHVRSGGGVKSNERTPKTKQCVRHLGGVTLVWFCWICFFFNFLSYLFNTCVRDSNITSVEGVVQFFSNYVYHIYFLLSSSQNNSNHNLTHFWIIGPLQPLLLDKGRTQEGKALLKEYLPSLSPSFWTLKTMLAKTTSMHKTRRASNRKWPYQGGLTLANSEGQNKLCEKHWHAKQHLRKKQFVKQAVPQWPSLG